MKAKRITEGTVWRIAANIVLTLLCLAALLPFVLLIIASFTDNQVAATEGFSFFPSALSLEAYRYIAREWNTIGRAYLMTFVVTIVGTGLSLAITSMFAYALSNKSFRAARL